MQLVGSGDGKLWAGVSNQIRGLAQRSTSYRALGAQNTTTLSVKCYLELRGEGDSKNHLSYCDFQ